METKDLNQLLDSVYELEGLLHLALSRDEMPASLPRLIRNKALAVAAVAADIPDCESAAAEFGREENPEVSSAYPVGGSMADDELCAEASTYDAQPVEAVLPAKAPEDIECADVRESVAPEPAEVADGNGVSRRPEPSLKGKDHAPSFSLNDRFLFIRELFGNDSSLFDRAMRTLPGFDTYEEAEVYFYDELGLEPDNRQVIRFMAAISNYFRSR